MNQDHKDPGSGKLDIDSRHNLFSAIQNTKRLKAFLWRITLRFILLKAFVACGEIFPFLPTLDWVFFHYLLDQVKVRVVGVGTPRATVLPPGRLERSDLPLQVLVRLAAVPGDRVKVDVLGAHVVLPRDGVTCNKEARFLSVAKNI